MTSRRTQTHGGCKRRGSVSPECRCIGSACQGNLMKNLTNNRRSCSVCDPEVELQRLKHRFGDISNRYFLAVNSVTSWQAYLPALAALGAFALYLGHMSLSPWPQGTTHNILPPFPNCAGAALVGLAPACKGGTGLLSAP